MNLRKRNYLSEAMKAKDILRKKVGMHTGYMPRSISVSRLDISDLDEAKKIKTSKGIFYFPSFQDARTYAKEHNFPTDRIIEYQKGWAIQFRKSGPYVGPEHVKEFRQFEKIKPGTRVKLVKGLFDVEKDLIKKGNVNFQFVRWAKPQGHAVVKDSSGAKWHIHPEALIKEDKKMNLRKRTYISEGRRPPKGTPRVGTRVVFDLNAVSKAVEDAVSSVARTMGLKISQWKPAKRLSGFSGRAARFSFLLTGKKEISSTDVKDFQKTASSVLRKTFATTDLERSLASIEVGPPVQGGMIMVAEVPRSFNVKEKY